MVMVHDTVHPIHFYSYMYYNIIPDSIDHHDNDDDTIVFFYSPFMFIAQMIYN